MAPYCQPGYEEHYHQVIASYTHEPKLNLAGGLQKDRMNETTMMEQRAEKIPPSRLPMALRKRRETPLLGLLGGIIGPVAWLRTYNDGQLIESKIQEFNETQASISHIVEQQTHLIRSQVEEMHKQARQHQTKHNLFKNDLTHLNQERGQAARKVAKLKFDRALIRTLQANEVAIEEYMRLADKI